MDFVRWVIENFGCGFVLWIFAIFMCIQVIDLSTFWIWAHLRLKIGQKSRIFGVDMAEERLERKNFEWKEPRDQAEKENFIGECYMVPMKRKFEKLVSWLEILILNFKINNPTYCSINYGCFDNFWDFYHFQKKIIFEKFACFDIVEFFAGGLVLIFRIFLWRLF